MPASPYSWNRGSVVLVAVFVASCGDNGAPTTPAAPSNRAPEPAGSIPDQTVGAGATETLDVSSYFRDPDGDALSYTATSSDARVVSVSQSGATLTIAGVAVGTAQVTVTASDPDGLTATQTFSATVPNSAPAVLGPIPDQTVHVGEMVTLDLSSYFTDADGDALNHTAASSDASVVSVSVPGATLTIAGVAVGTAQVTVTASDPDGLAATQTFGVTVPNRAPAVLAPIPDQTVHLGETITLDVSSYFTDPDGDTLSYGVSSSDPSVAASLAGAAVTITAVSRDSATVTVTATDPGGLGATQTFGATVPNRTPEPADPIPGQTLQAGETTALDLSPYFTDADGDPLTYAAASSDAAVVSVSVSGPTLTIAGLAKGAARVTVTASDPDGLTATQTPSVTVVLAAPDLAFTDVSPASATRTPGDSATFTFRVRNQGTVASGATTVRAMRSPNPIISTRDAELRSYSLSSLAPSQHRTFELTISVDPRSAPGTIYLGMCVDPVPDESNMRNNCSQGARLTIAGASSRRESTGSGLSVRIWIVPPAQFRRPAAAFRGKQSR